MKGAQLDVITREKMQRNELARYRKEGNIPAVVYGKHLDENILVSFEVKEFNRQLHAFGRSAVYALKSKDKKINGKSALIKEVQRNPLTEDILHVDMVEVTKGEKVHVELDLNFVGTALGTKEGGVLDIVKRSLEIECLPTDIPEHFDVDVSGLKINDVIHVSDLQLPGGVTTREDPSAAVAGVKVVVEKVVDVEDELADGDDAEVEVLSEKNKEPKE
jgi:large subunit ribosomal protein L25